MRALYAALLVTLVALPAAAQKPPQRPVAQKSAPAKLAGPYKDEFAKLMLFELRTQQWADRLSASADRGESMAIVDMSMRNTSTSLHGGDLQLKALEAVATPAQKAELAKVRLHHNAAQKAFDDLRAEINIKTRDPSRATVLRLSYKILDEAMLAQNKKPPKHPIIKTEPAK